MDDRNILNLLFERSEQALTVLGQKFGPGLLATARNILGETRTQKNASAIHTWPSGTQSHPQNPTLWPASFSRPVGIWH